jgi:hypothetical protein
MVNTEIQPMWCGNSAREKIYEMAELIDSAHGVSNRQEVIR